MNLGEKSRISFLIFGFLILFATLDSSTACSHSGRWRRRRVHHPFGFNNKNEDDRRYYRGKRAADYDDYEENELIVNTPCGESLCEGIDYYPHFQVSDIVNQVKLLMKSHNPLQSKLFFSTLSNEISRIQIHLEHEKNKDYPAESHNRCKTHKETINPRVGVSSDDGKKYYIVNLPSLTQTVTEIKCRTDQTCKDSSDTKGHCAQAYREQELLTLPVNVKLFRIHDFGINKFKVPHGCKCVPISYTDFFNTVQRV